MPKRRYGRWVLVLAMLLGVLAAALPAPAAADDGTWRDSAVPLEETATVGPFEVTVREVIADATDEILDEISFGEEPERGNQYFMVRVEVVYLGEEPASASLDLSFRAVGATNVGYSVYQNSCGIIPDQVFDVPELEEGDAAEFNVCWQVARGDADSLAMYVTEYVEYSGPVWFSLGFDNAQSSASPDKLRSGTVDAVTESSERDPVPFGTTAVVGDYLVTVIEVVPEADDLILDAYSFNDPPTRGNQFYMVTVEVTYTGSEIGIPWIDLDFFGIGEENPRYDQFENTCGVIPEGASSTGDLFRNGTLQFNVCWQIDSDDADDLLLVVEEFSVTTDNGPIWFSLTD